MRLQPVSPAATTPLADEDARLPERDVPSKRELREELDTLTERIDDLQRALYAESTRALLVVLQGRDASG
jgi:polyphosphate kinase 2 (PPK2 family)